MKSGLSVLIMLLAVLPACNSTCSTTAGDSAALPVHECSCGDPESDILGCPAGCCVSPENVCANALCTCSALHGEEGNG